MLKFKKKIITLMNNDYNYDSLCLLQIYILLTTGYLLSIEILS